MKYGCECKLPHQLSKTELRYRQVLNNFILDKYHIINVNDSWCMILGDGFKDKTSERSFEEIKKMEK